MFSLEAQGLNELSKAGVFSIPEVLLVDDEPPSGLPAFLAMEALMPGKPSTGGWAELGRSLARMHRVTASSFGSHHDNYIGRLPQSNLSENSWDNFFVKHRLEAQAEQGRGNGWFSAEIEKLFSSKLELIRELLLSAEEPPSLLHGDLWSGNVYWADFGPTIIDPAVYYGSREADLAFTECFNRFDQRFYESYNQEYPLSPGYEQRREVLNLYHLMTHSNLFGAGYISQFERALRDL
jgi:fructosamine-3-kinase